MRERDTTLAAALAERVHEGCGELVELTRELVRAPSPSPPGDERAAADVVRRYLAGLDGVQERLIALDARRPNLIYTVGAGPTIGLFAHTDTVPVGDDQWSGDPFDGARSGDRIYGRGTTDNKGAVAAMSLAFKLLAGVRDQLPGRVLFCANADEEQGGEFGIACVADAVAGELAAAVVAEPSGIHESFERLWIASRGVCAFRISLRGNQMHSSLADAPGSLDVAVNAAEELFRLWPDFRARFERHYPPGDGGVLLSPVRLEGGLDFGLVPGTACVWCECRVSPGMDRAETHATIAAILDAAANVVDVDATLAFEPTSYAWIEPTEISQSERVVRAAVTTWRDVLHSEPLLGTFPGGSDGAVLTAHGIPTLPGVGPGALMRAHATDEYVTVPELLIAAQLYVGIALAFLGDEELEQ